MHSIIHDLCNSKDEMEYNSLFVITYDISFVKLEINATIVITDFVAFAKTLVKIILNLQI